MPEVVKIRGRARLKSQPLKREMHFSAEHHCFFCKILWPLETLLAYNFDLSLQVYMYTRLCVLFTSHLSPNILGGLCYCVWL